MADPKKAPAPAPDVTESSASPVAKPEQEQVAAAAEAAPEGVPYVTAAASLPEPSPVTDAVPRRSQHLDSGLSRAFDLEVVPDSFAPATGNGQPVPHVRGPGQNPVDPVAAGLDLHNSPRSQDVRQAMTLTGRDVSGREPATYVEKTQGAPVVRDSDIAPTLDPKG